MSTDFAIAEVTTGKLNALVKNLMNQMNISDSNEAVRRVNAGEWIVSQSVRAWHKDKDNTIRFSVTSNGRTGEQWIVRLEDMGCRVSKYAKSVLRSSAFQPTKGVTTEIAMIPGSFWKTDAERTTRNIRAEGAKRGWKQGVDLNPEVACLIREMFSDEELKAMGLWAIVIMHEPTIDSGGDPCLLDVRRFDGGSWLSAVYAEPDSQWNAGDGFAFGAPQVPSA